MNELTYVEFPIGVGFTEVVFLPQFWEVAYSMESRDCVSRRQQDHCPGMNCLGAPGREHRDSLTRPKQVFGKFLRHLTGSRHSLVKMPRIARIVAPGVAHHVTQRGTNGQTVFFSVTDRRVYLDLLRLNAKLAGVRVLAYCLMDNHIHVVATPECDDSLAVAFRRAHGRYAQYLNARKLRCGHLWQNRFYSCPMEASHLWSAMRYVEMNPVRACEVVAPDDYEWSSARAHLSGSDPAGVLDMAFWRECGGAANWQDLLGTPAEEQETRILRRATYAGKPLGSEGFALSLRKPPGAAETAGEGSQPLVHSAPQAAAGA